MVSTTSSPGDTVISDEIGERLPPMGSAWKRNAVAPKIRFAGIVSRVTLLPVAVPSRIRCELR